MVGWLLKSSLGSESDAETIGDQRSIGALRPLLAQTVATPSEPHAWGSDGQSGSTAKQDDRKVRPAQHRNRHLVARFSFCAMLGFAVFKRLLNASE